MARPGSKTATDKTTIWVSKSTAAGLRRVEQYSRQSFDAIIRELINYKEIHSRGVDPALLKKSGKK